MIITSFGLQFFKIQHGDFVLAINPLSKKSRSPLAGKPSHFGADIALVSMQHSDFNGVENLSHGERAPFVISGPGEYDRCSVPIRGFLTKTHYGDKNEEHLNTVYSFVVDGMRLCFLGPVDSASFSDPSIWEGIGDVDILFLPIGGGDVLTPAQAYKLSLSVEPKVIIPMHYKEGGSELKKFLEEAGEKVSPEEKYTVKKKDLEGKEGEVVVLKQS
ncbi:MAG TPA: MBL fold metallo-hydrolase [Candidatus Paceibacterota bacterium]